MSVVLTSAEMRAREAAAMSAGVGGFELMQRAGAAVAAEAVRMLSGASRVLVLCGPGNNGGDGYVTATLLAEGGAEVTVASLAPPSVLGGDAALAAAGWSGTVLDVAACRPSEADLIVDALFGIGLGRDVDGAVAALMERVRAAGVPVLAVDIPSGVDADTGAVRGSAIRARRTVTFTSRKPGHLLRPGVALCGDVVVAGIGIDAGPLDVGPLALATNGPSLWNAAWPRADVVHHKYDRGHALVVSGGPANTGAARLAARAALRAGAGLVSVVTTARALAVNAAHLTAIMLRVCDDPDEFADLLTDDRFNAVVLGPALGISEATRRWVEAALEADRATVLDADALTSFAGEADALADLIRTPREHPVVLTPHDGEFKRLFGDAMAGLGSKVERARRAAALTGAVIVMKGPDTVIAAPEGRAAINANGSPHLATAGTGDVLGGMIGAFMARGMPGFEAAAAAVWAHADAARRFGPGLIAEDLPELLPAVLRDLERSESPLR